MKILVINSGSSSLKFQVVDPENEKALAKGVCERIGIDGIFNYRTDGGISLKEPVAMPDHKAAVGVLLSMLVDPERGVLKDFSEIDVVGHRLVHGGEKFTGSVVITEEVIQAMTECNDLAPLHNPANLVGVAACRVNRCSKPVCQRKWYWCWVRNMKGYRMPHAIRTICA